MEEPATEAVPAPVNPEQAALLQWEENTDGDDQQEAAAQQVGKMQTVQLCPKPEMRARAVDVPSVRSGNFAS